MMDIYDVQKIDLKSRGGVDKWVSMDVIPVEYGYFGMLLKITLRWNVVQSLIVDIFELYRLW